MYYLYAGKTRTDSNIAWHRPQSNTSRVNDELMEMSARALPAATEPIEKLRLLCLSRGASGVMALGRIVRQMDKDGSKHLNKEDFCKALNHTGIDLNDKDTETLFEQFDPDNSGSISIDEFIRKIRPPMADNRHTIVERAFKKLDKYGEGIVAIEDLRRVYAVSCNPRYLNGEESEDAVMNEFLAHFETECTVDGNVTLEEFMNYYSGISVSIDNDCYFDLMMRQAFKL